MKVVCLNVRLFSWKKIRFFFVDSVIANFIVSRELVENDDSGDCYWQKFYYRTSLKKILFVCLF